MKTSSDGNLYMYEGKGVLYEIIDDQINIFQGVPSSTGTYGTIAIDTDNKIWFAPYADSVIAIFLFNQQAHSNFGQNYTYNNYKFLDVNNVKAGYENRGGMFWDFVMSPEYEVPKGSGKHSLFAGALWLGGLDADSNLHTSAIRYHQVGTDFWPGPLSTLDGATDTASAVEYDRIWKVDRLTIAEFLSAHYLGLVASGDYTIPEEIQTWPAHGTGDYANNLAPFIDKNGDNIYDPTQGDYPDIKGDQMLWWILNDNLSTHTETSGTLFGVEIHCSAYAYRYDNPPDEDSALINQQTFLDYKVINRSDTAYTNVYTGFWTDADVGYPQDDFTGCDVKHNTFYFYNGDSLDGTGNGSTYGADPPIQTITILKGPLADPGDGIDNDHDSITDEADEQIGLSKYMYFNNTSGIQGDPSYGTQFYQYLRGYWKDGSRMKYGGTGYQLGGVEADYMFPGTSDPYGWGHRRHSAS